MQVPRRLTHQKQQAKNSLQGLNPRKFNYSLNYQKLDLRQDPTLYRVGVGEQGVLLVEPYKSEILPHWKFKTPKDAKVSAAKIYQLFLKYRKNKEFIGMDMARKFLQMGYTRSRRYANHSSGRKYDSKGRVLPFENDAQKALSAEIFYKAWKTVEADKIYTKLKKNGKSASAREICVRSGNLFGSKVALSIPEDSGADAQEGKLKNGNKKRNHHSNRSSRHLLVCEHGSGER